MVLKSESAPPLRPTASTDFYQRYEVCLTPQLLGAPPSGPCALYLEFGDADGEAGVPPPRCALAPGSALEPERIDGARFSAALKSPIAVLSERGSLAALDSDGTAIIEPAAKWKTVTLTLNLS